MLHNNSICICVIIAMVLHSKLIFYIDIYFRDLDHPNIIKLLGQCTETTPFLTIAEYPPMVFMLHNII
jgi:hypothetical protein